MGSWLWWGNFPALGQVWPEHVSALIKVLVGLPSEVGGRRSYTHPCSRTSNPWLEAVHFPTMAVWVWRMGIQPPTLTTMFLYFTTVSSPRQGLLTAWGWQWWQVGCRRQQVPQNWGLLTVSG